MNYKVLIAEDESIIRRGLICSMDWYSMGCTELLEASDGEEAVEIIRRDSPDIVIMDINIPLKNGLEVMEETADCGYSAIVLSGYAEMEFARRAMKSGAIRYLLKPVNFEELTEAILSAQDIRQQKLVYKEFRKRGSSFENLDLLADVAGNYSQDGPVEYILRYISQHYAEKMTLHKLAEEMHYSDTFLVRKFKEEMKIGFIEYLTRYRIQKAIALLKEGNTDMERIAERCGFQSAKYFSKVFTNQVGCSPREFIHRM